MAVKTWTNVQVAMQSALGASKTITAITKANPAVATSTAHGLANGDYVQAASHWTPPDPFEGVTPADLLRVQKAIKAGRGDAGEGWRANVQTGDAWVGHAIGQALGLDVGRPRDAARVRDLLRTWLSSGALGKADRSINAKGKTAPFVEVGRWAEI